MKNGLKINKWGTMFWHKDDKLHREDGPAIEWLDGYKRWYINGKFLTESESEFKLWQIENRKSKIEALDL